MGRLRYVSILLVFVFSVSALTAKPHACLAAGKTAKKNPEYTVSKEKLSGSTLKNLRLFSKVYTLIKNNYIKSVKIKYKHKHNKNNRLLRHKVIKLIHNLKGSSKKNDIKFIIMR